MKRKVLIVEPSEVIVDGLIAALTHSDLKLLTPEYNDAELTARLDMLKPDILISTVIRGEQSIIPDGATAIRPGDHAVIVARAGRIHNADEILEARA